MLSPAEKLFKEIEQEGYARVQLMVNEKLPESTWLDYKGIVNQKDGSFQWDSVEKYFSKAISGFGNSDGGLLIWGIDCPKELPESISDIPGIHALVGKLNDQISTTTRPAHGQVVNLPVPKVKGEDSGVVVTFIPLAPNRPLQARAKKIADKDFFIRAGESFGSAPKNALMGMLGRKALNYVQVSPRIEVGFSDSHKHIANINWPVQSPNFFVMVFHLDIDNWGPGLARDCYLTTEVYGLGEDSLYSRCRRASVFDFRVNVSPGKYACTVLSKESIRIAPGERVGCVNISVSFPVKEWTVEAKDFKFAARVGSDNSVPIYEVREVAGSWIQGRCKEMIDLKESRFVYEFWPWNDPGEIASESSSVNGKN